MGFAPRGRGGGDRGGRGGGFRGGGDRGRGGGRGGGGFRGKLSRVLARLRTTQLINRCQVAVVVEVTVDVVDVVAAVHHEAVVAAAVAAQLAAPRVERR